MTVATAPLGVSGYTFADLHEPERLASLYDRFCEDASAADPALWAEWDAYRRAPDAPRPPVALSNLLIAMAPHVSRFVTRLFDVDAPASAIAAATRAQDDLFRFKVDFVRRRALPLLKSGAHVAATPEDDAIVEALIARRVGARTASSRSRAPAARCSIARRRTTSAAVRSPRSRDRGAEALVRRADSRPRLPRLGRSSASPRTSSPGTWSRSSVPIPRLPEAMIGPDVAAAAARRLRADRRADAAARGPQRDRLLPATATSATRTPARRGCATRTARSSATRSASRSTAARSTRRSREMHVLRKARRCDRRAGARHRRQPDVPGHRPPHLQRLHEGLHLPEAGAGQHPADRDRRAHRRARLPWGVEIYGLLTRWNPLNVRAAVRAARTTARTCWSSASARPATRSSHYLLNEGFGVVGIDGLKIEPLADDIVGAETAAPRPIRDWSEIYRPLDERVLAGFGGVSEYGITVRWDKNFLTLLHLTLARRAAFRDVRRRPLRRHAADRGRVGARLRSRGDRRRRRQADDHRHEEQPDPRHPQGERLPDGAAAHRRVQARRAGEPAGAAAGDRHRRRPDRRSTPPPSCWRTTRCRSRRPLARYETLVGGARRGARCARCTTRRSASCSTSTCEHGRAVRAERGARGGGRRAARLRAAGRGVGRRLARLPQAHGRLAGLPPQPRGGRSRRSRRASRFVENLAPIEAVPDERGARAAR